MKLLYILFLICSFSALAQENTILTIKSQKLSEDRIITVHIPKSYTISTDLKYPVIYSLDGEYTRLALAGTVDYYSFWNKIPECIIVSIDQNYEDPTSNGYVRWSDCSYSWDSGLPKGKGIDFKAFISQELVPFIDSSYRTTNFRAIVGHSFTANFVNYFLLDEVPVFKGYIAISPYYVPNSLNPLKKSIQNQKQPVFYYTAAGEKDLSGHITSVTNFDKEFSKIDHPNFKYKKFERPNNGANHTTIFPLAILDGVAHLFSVYAPIDEIEFKQLESSENKVEYLQKKYRAVETIYGVNIEMRENDLNTASYAISKKKQWNQLKELGELTVSLFPKTFSGYWMLGEYEEQMKHYDLALKYYETGMSYLGKDVLNVSDFQKVIDRVKSKL
ncbi:alpha/beta hydrolase [Fluviicola taffensis]|uniref:Esterase n=1 Tax=Fluviicola taffensis (strain DSM 16823 / NCIMB 13979 / RW262) TaxID=755732 RepID=F2IFK1_FLUTR|nr:alpha/beta hydrolase-fold protein [Fluviicola taffensis]AEA45715.1 esterase [Fluviicola taffensis DSM 16823]